MVAFRRLLIGSGLIDILLRASAGFQQLPYPSQRPRLQFEHAGRGEQRRFCLQQIGTVDGEQGISLADLVANIKARINDPARVGRIEPTAFLTTLKGRGSAGLTLKAATCFSVMSTYCSTLTSDFAIVWVAFSVKELAA